MPGSAFGRGAVPAVRLMEGAWRSAYKSEMAAEVVDQVDQLVARQLGLLVEVDLPGEDAVEVVLAVGIRPLDGEHGFVQRLSELALGGPGHVSPGRLFRHREVVVLRVPGQQQRLVARHAGLDPRVGLGSDLSSS